MLSGVHRLITQRGERTAKSGRRVERFGWEPGARNKLIKLAYRNFRKRHASFRGLSKVRMPAAIRLWDPGEKLRGAGINGNGVSLHNTRRRRKTFARVIISNGSLSRAHG